MTVSVVCSNLLVQGISFSTSMVFFSVSPSESASFRPGDNAPSMESTCPCCVCLHCKEYVQSLCLQVFGLMPVGSFVTPPLHVLCFVAECFPWLLAMRNWASTFMMLTLPGSFNVHLYFVCCKYFLSQCKISLSWALQTSVFGKLSHC